MSLGCLPQLDCLVKGAGEQQVVGGVVGQRAQVLGMGGHRGHALGGAQVENAQPSMCGGCGSRGTGRRRGGTDWQSPRGAVGRKTAGAGISKMRCRFCLLNTSRQAGRMARAQHTAPGACAAPTCHDVVPRAVPGGCKLVKVLSG